MHDALFKWFLSVLCFSVLFRHASIALNWMSFVSPGSIQQVFVGTHFIIVVNISYISYV